MVEVQLHRVIGIRPDRVEDVLTRHFAGAGDFDRPRGRNEFALQNLVCLLHYLIAAATENTFREAALESEKVVGRVDYGIAAFVRDVALHDLDLEMANPLRVQHDRLQVFKLSIEHVRNADIVTQSRLLEQNWVLLLRIIFQDFVHSLDGLWPDYGVCRSVSQPSTSIIRSAQILSFGRSDPKVPRPVGTHPP